MVQFTVYHSLLAGYVFLMHVFRLSLMLHSAIRSVPCPASGYVSLIRVFSLSLQHIAVHLRGSFK